MSPKVDPTKGVENKLTSPSNDGAVIDKMMGAMEDFISYLQNSTDHFDAAEAFEKLKNYIKTYERILYSPLSNRIYGLYENTDGAPIGTISSNLDKIVDYADKMDLDEDEQQKQLIVDTKKAVLKIWDHVNLAYQQYHSLKQTDDEYDEKFNTRIAEYRQEMTKEMNAQLITMVSIFTALAFLIFGGISSLDNIFASSGIPLLKVMCSGLIWGICIFNMIFVFLFCVGKMTHMNFKSTNDPKANIFQKYPIVWWSNLIMISMLIVCVWVYFIQQEKIHQWFVNFCLGSPVITTILGSVIIAIVIFFAIRKLAKLSDVYESEKLRKSDR